MARKTHQSPVAAKEAILDAAEKLMVETGPAGLRISAVAKEAGMAHPNIIHHFGSREGLLEAICERIATRSTQRIASAISQAVEAKPEARADAMSHVFDMAYPGQEGRAAVWLHMSGNESSLEPNMQHIVELSHMFRKTIDTNATMDNTKRFVMLITLALIGEVVSGERLKQALGFDDEEQTSFRRWLAELLINLDDDQLSLKK